MKTHINFNTSSPILLNGGNTFGGMQVSNYFCGFGDDEQGNQSYFESFDLSNEYEDWGTLTLLATIADDMLYWDDFQKVHSVSELQNLIESVISRYTDDDLFKYIDRDDFDDYLVLLHIAGDAVKRGAVSEDDIRTFNDAGDDTFEIEEE